MARATAVSIPKLCVGQAFFAGAALRGRPPPGNHKGCPYGCSNAFWLRAGAGMSFSVASLYAQI